MNDTIDTGDNQNAGFGEDVQRRQLFEGLQGALAGSYEIERPLGEGGMAFVYLAHDVKHDRQVAIKVLKPELASSIGAERFLREIRTAAKLSHPHILPLFDSGEADRQLYYVMPFVEGESLADYLEREKQLPLDEAVRITREVAEALSVAHSLGLVHRDIKPENVMMTGGHAVVADFGIARAINQAGGEKLTQTGMAVGTPAYMSPEQATGDANIDGRADIYSLGCMLYEMLVGQIPYTAPTPVAMIARHTMDHPTPPHIMRDSIPPDLENIVLIAMEKTPADRFRTAQEFADALKAFEQGAAVKLRQSTMTRAPTASYGMPAAPSPWWRKAAVPAGIGAVVLVGGIAAWQLAAGGGRSTPQPLDTGLDPNGVAVLYFDDLSADSSLVHIAGGLTEGLIDRLSRVSGLNVISRNGVARYRGGGVPPDSIAQALDVALLVAGSVEPVRDSLRVTIRLVDGFSGTDLPDHRRTLTLPAARVLAVQDSIAQNVSGFLRQQLGQEVRLLQQRAAASSDEAWTLMQRAQRLRGEGFDLEREDPDLAMQKYVEADSLASLAAIDDAGWAEPVVFRGWVAYDMSFLAEGQQVAARMQTAIDRGSEAIGVDPGFADAWHLRGRSRYRMYLLGTTADPQEQERLLETAEADLDSAVTRDPTMANAWYALSNLHYDREDNMSAVMAARRAFEADAFLANQDRNLSQLFDTHYDLEQFRDANNWCQEGARLFPSDIRFVECQLKMLITPWAEANPDRAWELAREMPDLAPESEQELVKRRAQMYVGGALAMAGLPDSARAVLEAARAGPEIDPNQQLASDEAVMRIILGDLDEAVDIMKRYVALNPEHTFDLDQDLHWWWRPLRNHPGMRELASP